MTADNDAPLDPFEAWQAPIVPAIDIDEAAVDALMFRTVSEGATWPEADAARAARVPTDLVPEQVAEAVDWVRRVLRDDWLPARLPDRMVAATGILDGVDAVLAAWTTADRPFRVAVTRKRLHVLSVVPAEPATDATAEQRSAWLGGEALSFANAVLRLSEPLQPADVQARPFGGAVLMTRQAEATADWDQTILLLGRDRTVKLSVLRRIGRESPAKGVSPYAEEPPWFPRP